MDLGAIGRERSDVPGLWRRKFCRRGAEDGNAIFVCSWISERVVGILTRSIGCAFFRLSIGLSFAILQAEPRRHENLFSLIPIKGLAHCVFNLRFAFFAGLKAAIIIFQVCRDGAHKDRNLNRKNSRNALRGRGKDLWRPKCSFVNITLIHRNSECREVVIASPNRSIKSLYLM